jgi:hypothetical protein
MLEGYRRVWGAKTTNLLEDPVPRNIKMSFSLCYGRTW